MSKTIDFNPAKEKKSGGSGKLPAENFTGTLTGELVKFSGRTLKDIEKNQGKLEGVNKWGLFQCGDDGWWISVNEMMLYGYEHRDTFMHPKFDPNLPDDSKSVVPFDATYTITFNNGKQVSNVKGSGAEIKAYTYDDALKLVGSDEEVTKQFEIKAGKYYKK